MNTESCLKSKMAAAAAITANYEIGLNLKSIQFRDLIFHRPMFSGVRNAMKLSFAFYDLSNYLKIQNGRHLFARRYTFVGATN